MSNTTKSDTLLDTPRKEKLQASTEIVAPPAGKVSGPAAEKVLPSSRVHFKGRRHVAERFPQVAREIVDSPLFTETGSDIDREPLFCDLQGDLEDFARAAAFSLNHPDKGFYRAGDVLEDALSLFTVECIAEALSLHGIEDQATVAETCRCVLKGGRMFDGEGFSRKGEGFSQEGDSPAAPPPMTEEEADAFVKATLPGVDWISVGGWVSRELSQGRLSVCPACGFLVREGETCGVCAVRPEVASHLFEMDAEKEAFAKAAGLVVKHREGHAELLHEMNLNTYYSAENLLMSAMYDLVREAMGGQTHDEKKGGE